MPGKDWKDYSWKPGTVVHAHNPSYRGLGRRMVQAKKCKILSEKITKIKKGLKVWLK
jgi:hypothetical protein